MVATLESVLSEKEQRFKKRRSHRWLDTCLNGGCQFGQLRAQCGNHDKPDKPMRKYREVVNWKGEVVNKPNMKQRASLPPGKRFEILSRDNFTCRYCGRNSNEVAIEIDHIVPIAKGGLHIDENLVAACVECNLGKGDTYIGYSPPNEGDRSREWMIEHFWLA